MMKITVVIPTYNQAQYIRKAIDSILNQPYQNKELWVIDGGSNDGTVDVLKSYGDRIKWLSEPDKGQCDAIIKGYNRSEGEIFAFLNSDDWYEPNIFQDVVNGFSQHPGVTIVYGDINLVYRDRVLRKSPSRSLTYTKLIHFGNLSYQPATFFLKSALEKENAVEFFTHMMEYDMNLKVLKQGVSYYINKPLANFLIRPDQKSRPENRKLIMEEVVKINRIHQPNRVTFLYVVYLLSKFVPQKYLDYIKSRIINKL